MNVCRSKMPLMAVMSLPVMLLTSAFVMSQTSRMSTGIPVNDPPKAEGTIRVGLVTPRVSLLGGGGSVTQETNSLRQNLKSYLTGPRIGTVDLKAKLESLALEEARERECDYVLHTSLIRKRQPTTGAGGNYSGGTRAGDEFTFEYKVIATDGMKPVAENVSKGKVTSDGEDVLTPMIEKAAQTLVNLARAAKPAPVVTIEPASNTEVVGTPDDRPSPMTSSTPSPGTGYGSLTASPSRSRTTGAVTDPPKAEDAIRIGLATPRVTVIGGGGSLGSGESLALRQALADYLAGSTIELIDLRARLDSLSLAEGKQRQCDYVLYTSLIRKRQGGSSPNGAGSLSGIMGNLGAPGVSDKIPGGKTAQKVSGSAASVAGTFKALTRAKDEVTFEYKLVAIEEKRPVLTKVAKAKAKTDGEDVLMPMIETAAQAIVDATRKN